MHTIRPLPRPARHRLARHYLEMALAMLVGMSLLGPLEPWLLGAGWVDLRAAPEFDALVMAINMTLAMVAWSLWRRHIGLLTGAFLTSGQVLMFLAMAAVMLRHVKEYASPNASARSATRSLCASPR